MPVVWAPPGVRAEYMRAAAGAAGGIRADIHVEEVVMLAVIVMLCGLHDTQGPPGNPGDGCPHFAVRGMRGARLIYSWVDS